MKKITLFLLMLLLLAGCTNKMRNNHVYRRYYYEVDEFIKKIVSIDELNSFKSSGPISDDEILDKLKDYNNNYFEEKDLIIIYYPTGNSADKMYLSSIEIDDDIKINLNRNLSEEGLSDLMGHLFLIEIEKLDKEVTMHIKDIGYIPKEVKNCEFNKTYKILNIAEDEMSVTLKLINQKNETEEIKLKEGTYNIDFKVNNLYKFTFNSSNNHEQKEDNIKNIFGFFQMKEIELVNNYIDNDICYGE